MAGVFYIVGLIAFISALPVWYDMLCQRMSAANVPQPPRWPFLFLFGSYGGWVLAFALPTSVLTALLMIFLVMVAPLLLLASALWLWRQRKLSGYHRTACYGCLAYVILLAYYLFAISVIK